MIPKKNRNSQKSIDLIFKKGKFINSQNINLKFYLDKEYPNIRVSFVVPKSVAKSAVKRNALRRRGYQVISKYIHSLPAGFNGAFLFGKNSKEVFGQRGVAKNEAFVCLDKEIQFILSILNNNA